ncbi:MAG: SDR family oxidoreductase [Bacteroidia bacterium]|nr:SDR family oxidoreductase [Bacteroidia bacterium]
MPKYALILGATSDIARAVSQQFATHGYHLYLAGRNWEAIHAEASDLKIRFQVEAVPVRFDVLDFDSHAAIWNGLNPKPEVVVCVVGYMPEQEDSQKDLALARKVMDSNFTGCANFLNLVANDFEAQKTGSIIGVSSVAGDRGRAKNYLYGAAKAGFTAYLSGLRNRLSKSGIQVLTVKPGFVQTRMTEHLELKGALVATADQVGKDIWNGFRKKKNVIYTKGIWKYVMLVIRHIPERLFKKMNL